MTDQRTVFLLEEGSDPETNVIGVYASFEAAAAAAGPQGGWERYESTAGPELCWWTRGGPWTDGPGGVITEYPVQG